MKTLHQELETKIRSELTVSHFMYLTIKARRKPVTEATLQDKFNNGGIADLLMKHDTIGYIAAISEIKNQNQLHEKTSNQAFIRRKSKGIAGAKAYR